MAQNIENRQRVIFISNATEYYNDGEKQSLQELSKEFPNVVFFTDDYDAEHTYSAGHRVNIWKGGQKYIKVHGVKPNSSVKVGNTTLTLVLSENGLLSLSVLSSIDNIVVLGAVPYKINTKNASAQTAVIGIDTSGIGKVEADGKVSYRLSSNINRYALYLAFQKDKEEGELDASLVIHNSNQLYSDATNQTLTSVKKITSLAELKSDLGLTGNCSTVFKYNDAAITSMFDNQGENPFNPDTASYPNYEIYKYDIDITKLFLSGVVESHPTIVESDDVVVKVRDTNDEVFNSVNGKHLTFADIYFEPFFNKLATTGKSESLEGISSYTSNITVKPYIATKTRDILASDSDFDSLFNKYENVNYEVKLNFYPVDSKLNIINKAIDITQLNSKLQFNGLTKPSGTTREFTGSITVEKLCDKAVEDYLKKNNVDFDGSIVSLRVVAEASKRNNVALNLPLSSEFKTNSLLDTEYVYASGFNLNIASGTQRVVILVTEDTDNAVNKINEELLNPTSKFALDVASFDTLTQPTNHTDGNKIELSKYCVGSNAGGYVYIALPKEFTYKKGTNKFGNLLISNGISYKVAIDNSINPRTAYFAVVPEEITSGVDDGYYVLKVKAPLTGSILLLNNNENSKIYSNV